MITNPSFNFLSFLFELPLTTREFSGINGEISLEMDSGFMTRILLPYCMIDRPSVNWKSV